MIASARAVWQSISKKKKTGFCQFYVRILKKRYAYEIFLLPIVMGCKKINLEKINCN